MKVLVIHNDYARFSGEEEAIETLAGVLTRRGHEVAWFRRSSADVAGSLRGEAKAFFAGIYNPSSRAEVFQLLTAGRFDIVQLQNMYPLISPSVLLACRDAGVPVVMRCPNHRLFCPTGLHLLRGAICERCLGPGREWHCVLNNCEGLLLKSVGYAARGAFARLTKMVLENVRCFLVLSEFQRKRFAALGIDETRLVVLPNIVPTVTSEDGSGAGEYVGYVGRLSAEKGIGVLLEAARLLPDVQFGVAAGLEDARGFVTRAPGNVRFHGFLSGRELDDFYARSRLLVCPSVCWEGFPNVVTRAMAHSKPVVASNLGVLTEIVEDGKSGLLFPPGDAAELAAAIASLWQDPARCRFMGIVGRQRAAQEYSEARYYEQLITAYRRVLGGKLGHPARLRAEGTIET